MRQRLLHAIGALCLLSAVTCAVVMHGFASDDYQAAVRAVAAANSWKAGQPIPRKLLTYRTSWEEGSCFPSLSGTESMFACVSNYILLRTVVFLPEVDMRVFSNAVERALTVGGPNRFLGDVASTLDQRRELLKQDRFKMLKEQTRLKHIVVESLYITYADMEPEQGKQVLEEIKAALQQGRSWTDVYWEYLRKYKEGTRSKIGNLGQFVLPEKGKVPFSVRDYSMPKEHIPTLFTGKPGEVFILFDKEDLSRFPDLQKRETGERNVLHRIREVFPGL